MNDVIRLALALGVAQHTRQLFKRGRTQHVQLKGGACLVGQSLNEFAGHGAEGNIVTLPGPANYQ